MSFEEYAQAANQIFGSPKKSNVQAQTEEFPARPDVIHAYLPKYQLIESCREAFEIIDKVDLPAILQNNSSSMNLGGGNGHLGATSFNSRKISYGLTKKPMIQSPKEQ